MYDDPVTYEVLPPRTWVESQILVCSMKGHKFDIGKDGKSLFCHDCGTVWQER